MRVIQLLTILFGLFGILFVTLGLVFSLRTRFPKTTPTQKTVFTCISFIMGGGLLVATLILGLLSLSMNSQQSFNGRQVLSQVDMPSRDNKNAFSLEEVPLPDFHEDLAESILRTENNPFVLVGFDSFQIVPLNNNYVSIDVPVLDGNEISIGENMVNSQVRGIDITVKIGSNQIYSYNSLIRTLNEEIGVTVQRMEEDGVASNITVNPTLHERGDSFMKFVTFTDLVYEGMSPGMMMVKVDEYLGYAVITTVKFISLVDFSNYFHEIDYARLVEDIFIVYGLEGF